MMEAEPETLTIDELRAEIDRLRHPDGGMSGGNGVRLIKLLSEVILRLTAPRAA